MFAGLISIIKVILLKYTLFLLTELIITPTKLTTEPVFQLTDQKGVQKRNGSKMKFSI